MSVNLRRTKGFCLSNLKNGLLNHDNVCLAKAITLIESNKAEHRKLATKFLNLLHGQPSRNTWRIGITGVPGVGKSTFINVFGKALIEQGHRVAVLSIDPSSTKTKGSILGDKSRMDILSQEKNAFIRPSSSGTYLGGVARSTQDTILLCEIAGFDVVLVETVGVGQNEVLVREMVDYFVLLALPGGGDELQGIKRGIMEMTDHMLITKSDGYNQATARQSKKEYENALHLMPPHETGWVVPVDTCSAVTEEGISDAMVKISDFFLQHSADGWIAKNRKRQKIAYFQTRVMEELRSRFFSNPSNQKSLSDLQKRLNTSEMSVGEALNILFKD